MGALGQFIDELQEKIVELETERDMYKGRYEDICAMLKKKANDDRNNDDDFLTSYNKERDFWN